MLELSFVNETNINMSEWEKQADQIISKGVELLNLHQDNLSLTIHFVDGIGALKMNEQYRQKTYVPDVLSFPTLMTEKEVKAMGFKEIGDIFICLEEAERKSIKYDHSVQEEMGFLFIHGFLHLLGYDHENNIAEEKEMFYLQDQILAGVGLSYEIRFTADDYLEQGL